MFVQKLNPLTGEADWVLVNDPGLGDNDDASADLVATSSYLDMLTDRRRNAAYYAAIRRVIPARKQESSAAAAAAGATTCGQASSSADGAGAGTDLSAVPAPNDREDVRVLDIGTGTGLLAMMAARVLATGDGVVTASGGDAATGAVAAAVDATPSAPVIACEVFPPMHNLSRRVIAGNGLASMIRVLNKRSDEIVAQHPGGTAAAAPAAAKQPKAALQAAVVAHAAAAAAGGGAAAGPDMYGRADIIVTEIFDSELLGEGMIPTMRHAVQHLLKDDGVVIPATSRVYGQLVKCPLMHLMTGLRFGDPCPWPSDGVSAYTAIGDGAGGGCASVPSKSTAAAVTDAAADRVLEALGELDARARVATFCSEDLYEVREMHVDLLYQHAVCRDPSPAPQVSPQYLEVGLKTQQQQPLQTLSDPFLVFEFDWLRPPPPSGRQTVCKVPVLQDGSAHAVLLWWQLGMMPPQYDTRMAAAEPQHQAGRMQNEDPESDRPPVPGGRAPGFSGAACHSPVDRSPQAEPCLQPDAAPLLLSTAPAWLGDCVEAGGDGGPLEGVKQQWRDHWKQCWVQLAYDAVPVRRGNVLRIAFEHDDFNIRSKMVAEAQPGKPAAAAVAAAATVSTSTVANLGTSVAGAPKPLLQSAKERLVALQAEVEEEALTRQQLMPLLSWLGPLALLQLGDRERLHAFGAALRTALEEVAASNGNGVSSAVSGAEVLVVDGSLSLGLLAACHPAVASVTLLQEDNVSAQNWLRASARRVGLAPNKIKSIRSETYFKKLRAASACSASANAGPLVLVSEPYFSGFEQLVPWAHLKFWRDYDVIRGSSAARGGRKVTNFPRRARLVAVAAALPELWRTRCALGDVEGFDLSAANVILGVVGMDGDVRRNRPGCGDGDNSGCGGGGGRQITDKEAAAVASRCSKDADHDADNDEDDLSGDVSRGHGGAECSGSAGGPERQQQLPILPYSVWQAGGGYQELSARQDLLVLDCGGHLDDVQGAVTLTAVHGSMCHAVVLWLEYDLVPTATMAAVHGPGSDGLVVSTAPAADGGPRPTVQGVYLLRQPVELTHGSRLHVAAQFDGLDADISVEVTVLAPLASEISKGNVAKGSMA